MASCKAQKQEGLGLWNLVWIATGQAIGAGVITITGTCVGVTGRSAWIAYGVAVLVGLIRILPMIFFSSIMVLKGGNYGIITRALGAKWGGVMTLSNLLGWSARGVAVISIGQYINSVFPSVNIVVAGVVVWTFIWIVNMRGINMMSRVQGWMTPALIAALMLFAIMGFFHLDPETFNTNSPEFLTDGIGGFMTAVVLFCYSTNGQGMVIALSEKCKNPTKDLPIAMLISTFIMLIVYCSVSLTAGGVLPLQEIINQPLTPTARLVMPQTLFVLFMIAGPIFALATTMNGGIPNNAYPVVAGVEEGWLPEVMAKKNGANIPWVSYTIIYIVGLIPILTGVSIGQITSFVIILSSFTNILLIASAFVMPTKYGDQWKRSSIHIPNPLYYSLISAFGLIQCYIVYRSFLGLTPTLTVVNIATFVFVFAYGFYRLKSGKVNIEAIEAKIH